jgi:hypothetical protein
MIIDFHTHLIAQGWVPRKIFHGIARFVTQEEISRLMGGNAQKLLGF